MVYVAAFAAVFVFVIALERLAVRRVGEQVVATSKVATIDMRDRQLSDSEKERRVRLAAISLAAGFVSIIWRTSGAVLSGLLVLALFDVLGLASLGATTSWLATWEACLIVTAVIGATYLARQRL